jgi:hypothetical protein
MRSRKRSRASGLLPIIPLAAGAQPRPGTDFPRPMNRRNYPISLQQAAQSSPTLAKLVAMTQDSSARLQAIQPLMPITLRKGVQAGPIEGSCWCLLVNSNAAAAKLRQLLPAFAAHLRVKGWDVTEIRLRVKS